MERKLTRRRFLRDAVCGIFGALSVPSCIGFREHFKDPVIRQIDFELLAWYVHYEPTDRGWDLEIILRPQDEIKKSVKFSVAFFDPANRPTLDVAKEKLFTEIACYWIEKWDQRPLEAYDKWDECWHTVMEGGVTVNEHFYIDEKWWAWDNKTPAPPLSIESLQKLYDQCVRYPTFSRFAEYRSSRSKTLRLRERDWTAPWQETKRKLTRLA